MPTPARKPNSKPLPPPARRAPAALALLKQTYPDSKCSLNYTSPLELLVATILSAQCTDARVNQTTPALFTRYPSAAAYAAADPAELEHALASLPMFRNKAKALKKLGQQLLERHAGQVPSTMADLIELAGTGRKTANVVLGVAFKTNEGICVDTHCARLSQRLGLTAADDPKQIEQDLIPLLPRPEWCVWTQLLIDHGRAICTARKPKCPRCVLRPHCPSAEKFMASGEAGE